MSESDLKLARDHMNNPEWMKKTYDEYLSTVPARKRGTVNFGIFVGEKLANIKKCLEKNGE